MKLTSKQQQQKKIKKKYMLQLFFPSFVICHDLGISGLNQFDRTKNSIL